MRENLTDICVWKNKQTKQLEKLREELGSVVDEDLFDKAYAYATKEKFGCLTVSFRPKHPDLTFRKGLSEAIVFCPQKKENDGEEK